MRQQSSVLFLCTGNSARSQMAEAFLRQYGGDRFEAYSAGLEPKEIHPYTRQVMKEIGIDLTGQRSKHLSEYMGKVHFGYVITVCAHADESCPAVFPGMGQRLHWAFDDPAAFEGTDAQIWTSSAGCATDERCWRYSRYGPAAALLRRAISVRRHPCSDLDKFRRVRDEIDGRIQAWLQEQGVTPSQGGGDAAPQV